MTTPRAYLAIDGADELVTLLPVPTADKTRWAALTTPQRDALLLGATSDIDAVLWRGACAVHEQPLMWPRVSHAAYSAWYDEPVIADALVEPADPDAHASDPVALLPRRVRWACALQAVSRMRALTGLDATAHASEAARRGVTGHSGGGASESIDLGVANSAWAQLCRGAQAELRPLRAGGGTSV